MIAAMPETRAIRFVGREVCDLVPTYTSDTERETIS
jgi:hypothetical protein